MIQSTNSGPRCSCRGAQTTWSHPFMSCGWSGKQQPQCQDEDTTMPLLVVIDDEVGLPRTYLISDLGTCYQGNRFMWCLMDSFFSIWESGCFLLLLFNFCHQLMLSTWLIACQLVCFFQGGWAWEQHEYLIKGFTRTGKETSMPRVLFWGSPRESCVVLRHDICGRAILAGDTWSSHYHIKI